jgi:hypothetical protein
MASIIDPTIEELGNPTRALESVSAVSTTAQTTQQTQAAQIPDRLKGKSTEELYQIYANLERHAGRLANDLGQQRQMTDQLLQLKRENDLRANGATQVQQQAAKAPVSASDLLENPQEALDRYFESKESGTINELKNRLAMQEAQMAQTNFVSRHPDWQEHTNDPTFVEWARQTPWRSNLAAAAARNDLSAADALLTEYKAYQPLLQKTTQSTNLDAARRVGFERTASAGDATSAATGPIIRRADSMALRISDPDKYESPAYQNALLSAIRDGRYK